MIKTTCKKAGTPKACPKKVTQLLYVTRPKAPKPLMGPFLTEAKCGRVVMRSADALVTACLIDSLDDLTYWHAVNNGRICRAFAGSAKGAA
jgi:hypothetical protein